MSAPIHIFVCQPSDKGMDILAEWTFQSSAPQSGRGSDLMLGAAFVERLAKRLRDDLHPACRVAEPIRETSALPVSRTDLLEGAGSAEETREGQS